MRTWRNCTSPSQDRRSSPHRHLPAGDGLRQGIRCEAIGGTWRTQKGEVRDKMDTFWFLYRKLLINRVKIAVRKPVTYVYLALLLFYFFVLPASLRLMVEQFGIGSPEGFAGVLTVLAIWLIPANLIAYAKRKGLMYRNSDVHFLFPAPVGPKQVLLYAYLKTLFVQVIMNLFAIVCGFRMFHVEGWRLAVYFLFSIFAENLLEGGIMVLLYGSEKLGERQRRVVVAVAYALAAVLVLMGIAAYLQGGLRLGTVAAFLHSDRIQMVPLVGWYIGVVHLLFTEATAANVAGTVCYLLLLAGVVAAAWRMKCTGAYYEDAVKFAEDYEEVLESRRQGNVQKRLGRKQKFGKAHVRWRGKGAAALFYRQLLEYKKNRFFLFDFHTVISLLIGAGLAYLYAREGGFGFMEGYKAFVMPVVSAYLIFVFNAFNGKWGKELASPYTYLIPDSPFRKLMGATMMQHVQSLVNGCLLILPGAVAMEIGTLCTVLSIVFYVELSANKLYALAVAEAVTGSTLGTMGRQMFHMLFHSIAIFVAVMGAMAGMLTGTVLTALVLMDVFLALITIVFLVIAMLNFYHMEAVR